MEITANNIMLIVAVLLSLSVLVGKAGSRFGMPALLLFLGVGMLSGVDGFGLHFDSVETVQFIGMIALSIILFSGGVDTRFQDIKPIVGAGVVLATLGVLLTTLITAAFIYGIFSHILPDYHFGIIESLLLAAIMSSTDSASVFSILNSTHTGLKQNLKPTLELESGSNDPMAYLLVVILISISESGASLTSGVVWSAFITLFQELALGTVCGIAIGFLSVKVINWLRADNEFLYPIMMIACVFFAFALTQIAGGNCYLAVYVAGLIVGNSKIALKHTITTFFGGFTWLVQIIMFLSLGLLVNPHELIEESVLIPGLALGIFMILIARPISVFISLLPFKHFTFKARLYISWVGLRGAVPIIFATLVVIAPGVTHGDLMFNMVFFITILSLLIQGTTVKKMAQWLGLTEPIDEQEFKMYLPDDISTTLTELKVEPHMLTNGSMLKEIQLPTDTLVIMIKHRGNIKVPRGNTKIYIGDTLLLISEKEDSLADFTPAT